MATPSPTQPLVPQLSPPPGVTSNFENPDSLLYLCDIAVGICIPFVTIFFFLRCYSRIFIKKSWIVEDWLALTAWAGTVAFCGITSGVMRHNGGKHGWDITPEQAHEAVYWFNAASIEYGVANCAVKLAVLWLYRRVFSPQRFKPFDLSILILAAICVGFYGSTTFVKIFECDPREKIFNTRLDGRCVDIPMLLNTSGMFNTITDFIILFLPVKAVWNLNMPWKKKMTVVLVFTFGLCAPAFSIIGFVVRIRASRNRDTTWVQPEILLWGAAELATGNLCMCFPEMGALLYRRKGSRPTPSILNGAYRRSHMRGRGSFGNNNSDARANVNKSSDDSYLELTDRDAYGVQIECGNNHRTHSDPTEVFVTSEVMIDSRNA